MIRHKHNLLPIVLLLATSLIHANTIRVPQDYAAIQEAIDHSQLGDTVLVAPGTYYENIDFKGKNIVVASHFVLDGNPDYIKNTIINGSKPVKPDTASCITFAKGEDSTAVIDGFTITGGSGTRYLYSNGYFREGGGVFIDKSSPTVKNNLIINNTVTNIKNVVNAGGGGFHVTYGNPYIINNIVMKNVGRFGAGFIMDYTGGILKNNIICENSGATDYGGGGGLWIAMKHTSPIVIENNTISNNSGNGIGGILLQSTKAVLRNNIIWGNPQGQISVSEAFGTSEVEITYNDIENDYQGKGVGEGNIDQDPKFVNAYLLSNSSPCIDAGDPDASFNDPTNLSKPDSALFPAKGNLRNDIGSYGGPNSRISMSTFFSNSYSRFTSPANGVVIKYPNQVPLSIEIYNFDPIVINYYSNNQKIGEVQTPPYELLWTPAKAGDFILTAKVINGTGDTMQTINPIFVEVVNSNLTIAASSRESYSMGPYKAIDGNLGTRWASQFSDPQWICIDFGNIISIKGVTLRWEAAYGKAYQIQTSTDSLTWNNVYSTSSGKGGREIISFEPTATRFVRMYGTQRATSYGYSLWEFQIDTVKTNGIKETNASPIPKQFALHQNYPNPFNPTTNIGFDVKDLGFVTLKIFDMLGREVTTLVNEEKPAGSYQVQWNAEGFVSGIYFYRLQVNPVSDEKVTSIIKTKRLVLLR